MTITSTLHSFRALSSRYRRAAHACHRSSTEGRCEMLGHGHISITLGIYGHVTPSMGREAAAAPSASLLS
jgi:hypothetical protein